ncbi:hypothetical protein N865_09275 [Intrasporangium oryzae NRRL B-24470]|uniref:Uncharacterized protein n=1 Tax=Intrasporangium oryzae NRRL B-24470 TaxID=1386089 RepID=W9GBV3_9MICO|nr:hypothetical protein [Intrasporangium oryzae]EWT03691.1 hypothetical protein N865_09275 [Intrasporangium oryzae NRRL B-24470]
MRIFPMVAAAALATSAVLATAGSASAAQDTSCQHAGIKTLQSVKVDKGGNLLAAVARDGLPISTAVSLGVTVRPGASLAGVPDPLPLSLILADHRAGDSSIFIYPWC